MSSLIHSVAATWSPFVLVAGLLLIGQVAADEGLFRFVGSWCARVPGGGVGSFLVTMAAVALVSAVLNLDTSVVFMTPVALQAARAKGTDESAFLYGTVFMSNSASLLLVGSNLTNLIVFAPLDVSGASFAAHSAVAWVVTVVTTTLVVLLWRWRYLRRATSPSRFPRAGAPYVAGPGLVATLFAVVAMLAISHSAVWVLAAGLVAQVISLAKKRSFAWRDVVAVVSPVTLGVLFAVAVLVGWFARAYDVTTRLLGHADVAGTAALAALAASVINNLPAASLFAAHRVAHPFALLLGLDVGPNLMVTAALSSLLWWRITRREGFAPSRRTFSLVGGVVTVASVVLAIVLA